MRDVFKNTYASFTYDDAMRLSLRFAILCGYENRDPCDVAAEEIFHILPLDDGSYYARYITPAVREKKLSV